MHKIRTTLNICLGMFLLFSLFVPQNASGSQIHLPFAEIAQTADLIFVGTAVQESCWINQQQTMIFTDILFQDISVVHAKGRSRQKDSQAINLTFAGGTLDGRGIRISGTPEFQMGHRYLIFAFDDGKVYVNPNVGGNQGLYEVIKDTQTGESHVLTAGGKAVLGFDADGLKTSRGRVLEIKGGVIHAAESENNLVGPPSSSDPKSSAKTRHVETAEGSPLSLEDFIHHIKNRALITPLKKRMLKLDGQGVFYRSDGQKIEVENLKLTDPSQLPKPDEIDPKQSPPDLHVPEADGNSQSGHVGERSGGITGGTLESCGFQDRHLVMEQVPTSWWSYDDNNDAMWTWNQCMDLYQYTPNDGSFGWPNTEDEFSGWVDGPTLSSVYGMSWGSGIAMTVWWWMCDCCKIRESDVMWNPAYSWTDDFNFSLGNSGVILLLPNCMHELGHTWGYKTQNETYYYDDPSVMHAYYDDVVENGWGIHVPDAYIFRRTYDDQTSILSTRDIGVESYWASNGLNNSFTDASNYCPGDPITFNNVTVENISYNALSEVRIRFYFSANKTISTSDYQIGGYWSWASFGGEAYWTGNFTTTVPSGIPDGQYYVGMIVTIDGFGSDDYGFNNATFFYDRITVNGPVGQVSPGSLNFGNVCVGSYVNKTFTITNTCGGTLSGTPSESCSHYSIVSGGGSYNLGFGQSRTVTVRFQPTSTGTKNCTIETGNSLCPDVSCTGHAVAPVCHVSPTSLDFGTVCVGSYADKTFTITNISGYDCQLYGTVIEVYQHYSLVSGGGSYSLGSGQTRTVTVRFEPTLTGPKNCNVATGNSLCDNVSCTGVGQFCCDCGVWGDVNDDGEINPIDVVYMVNFVYKNDDLRTQPPNCPYEAGDVDCNNEVNPVDAVRYVNYVYKNITPWPCEEPCGP